MDSIDEAIKKLMDTDTKDLVLLNDDINTFHNIMSCLSCYLNMDNIQAEQCAIIVHNKGECIIKSGTREDLLFIHDRLKYHRIKSVIR